jgi:hypothetical protein
MDAKGAKENQRLTTVWSVTTKPTAGYADMRGSNDAEHLYVAFRNTRHSKVRLYPEVMIDPRNLKSDSWQPGQWWLHASNNLCEAEGAYNVYSCTHTKTGWDANNPPGGDGVEFQIDLAKVGLCSNASFGIAFDVTDATGNFTQKWSLWPAFSNIRWPKTWGQATLAPAK